MESGRFFLICILVLFNVLGNTKGEPQFSKDNLPRESPRSLDSSEDNYLLVQYRNFISKLKGFKTKNTEIKIAHIYMGNDEKDYIESIKTFQITPGAQLRLVFSTPPTTLANLFYDMREIKSIDFSHFNSKEVANMNSLFYRCYNLEAITFGDNFNTSKVTDMSHLFEDCDSLTSIDLSKFNTKSVTTMIYMFSYCNKLTEINLKTFNTEKVITIEGLFSRCTGLETITFGDNFNTGKVTDMSYLFERCSSLTSINLTKFNTESVTTMNYMFSYCSKLTEINLKTFNTEKVISREGMFADCVKLTSLDLSYFKTPSLRTFAYIVIRCSSLVTLDISNFNLTKQGKYDIILSTFDGLTNLKYLNLLNIEMGSIMDFSLTDLDDKANLTICKNSGIKAFSNETSKIFRCCETPFNTSKCNNNYIIIILLQLW